jgi:hypothetical protein
MKAPSRQSNARNYTLICSGACVHLPWAWTGVWCIWPASWVQYMSPDMGPETQCSAVQRCNAVQSEGHRARTLPQAMCTMAHVASVYTYTAEAGEADHLRCGAAQQEIRAARPPNSGCGVTPRVQPLLLTQCSARHAQLLRARPRLTSSLPQRQATDKPVASRRPVDGRAHKLEQACLFRSLSGLLVVFPARGERQRHEDRFDAAARA